MGCRWNGAKGRSCVPRLLQCVASRRRGGRWGQRAWAVLGRDMVFSHGRNSILGSFGRIGDVVLIFLSPLLVLCFSYYTIRVLRRLKASMPLFPCCPCT